MTSLPILDPMPIMQKTDDTQNSDNEDLLKQICVLWLYFLRGRIMQ